MISGRTHREFIADLSLSASPNTFIKFLAFEFVSPPPPPEEIWTASSISRMVIIRIAPFISTSFVLLLALPFRAPRRGDRRKREITSWCMIARIGCPEGSVRHAFSLASSLRSLSFCERTGALAIKTTMMTDAISVALPTGFFALHTRYVFCCLFVENHSLYSASFLWYYLNKIYILLKLNLRLFKWKLR